MFETDQERIGCLYKDSMERLRKTLEVLDKRRSVVDDIEARLRISEQATGKMSKTHKWLLLNKVFGLLPPEIAEMYGANVKTVCARIKDVADMVVTDKLIFMDSTTEEIKQARQSIEVKRARDRRL